MNERCKHGIYPECCSICDRCELTDLRTKQCAHCQKQTLGDEEDNRVWFSGLMKGLGNV